MPLEKKIKYVIRKFSALNEEKDLESHLSPNEFPALPEKFKKLRKIKIEKLGGANFSLFSIALKSKDSSPFLIARLVPNSDNITARKAIAATDAEKHLSKVYLLLDPYSAKQKSDAPDLLEFSEICNNGDLAYVAKTFNGTNPERVNLTIGYMKNLFSMMLDFNAHNIRYPDVKPSNFLINDQNRLIISDTKSLFPLTDKKAYPSRYIVDTEGYRSPTEFQSRTLQLDLSTVTAADLAALKNKTYTVESIDQEISYKIGVTLYEVATGHMVAAENRLDDGAHNFNFNHLVFSDKKGEILKKIITGLTDKNPESRLSISVANQMLEKYLAKLASPRTTSTTTQVSKALNIRPQPQPQPQAKPVEKKEKKTPKDHTSSSPVTPEHESTGNEKPRRPSFK